MRRGTAINNNKRPEGSFPKTGFDLEKMSTSVLGLKLLASVLMRSGSSREAKQAHDNHKYTGNSNHRECLDRKQRTRILGLFVSGTGLKHELAQAGTTNDKIVENLGDNEIKKILE